MTFIELPEPVPRGHPLRLARERIAIANREFLVIPKQPVDISFWNVIAGRRSRRQFGKLDRMALSQLLWHAIKTRESSTPSSGARWQSRPYPSAGGIHPIEVLVVESGKMECRCGWYNAVSHSLDTPEIIDPEGANSLLAAANEVIPIGDGTVLWFVANMNRSSEQYFNPESLVWRDSGALLTALYLVAEALEMSCCGIGATGSQCVRFSLGLESEHVGVGGCVIGSRVSGPFA